MSRYPVTIVNPAPRTSPSGSARPPRRLRDRHARRVDRHSSTRDLFLIRGDAARRDHGVAKSSMRKVSGAAAGPGGAESAARGPRAAVHGVAA